MRKLLLATHNPGKIREYRALLAALPLEVTTLEAEGIVEDVEETGTTFAENAILKAQAYAELSGLWTWADDSGLEVDALDGRPGVYSARYAGPGASDRDRYTKLLRELNEIQAKERTARFCCVVALALSDGQMLTAEGTVEGLIGRQPKGEHGFGYDPVFYLPDHNQTMAELPPHVKNDISHRAIASRRARDLLRIVLDTPR